jgi:cytochrome c-type biogenesis protein CcmH/NrfG
LIALVALVFAIYAPTLRHGFLNFDDPLYVTENPIVLQGLTLAGVKYAFASVCDENWHPLTLLLHMMDCQLYGNWAGGHHLTCLLLHALGAVLLFLLLRQMTGALWKSAFVAALWAVHPLRVESVAWIAELKDVLSGVFFFLTLIAYVDYTRRRTLLRYLLVMVLLALGLMSKPMLVTLPFVLLLLDYWPLRRTQGMQLLVLVLEKLPLFGLSVISVMTTLWAQEGAIGIMAPTPFSVRLAGAVVAYGAYLREMVWPFGLAILDPMPSAGFPSWQVAFFLLLLIGITTWVIRAAVTTPCLPVGWFWYLGMLVPVIGLIKVGNQAFADRYTYLPMIGLLIALVWWLGGVGMKGKQKHSRIAALAALGVLIILLLSFLSWKQISLWESDEKLWKHSISCTEESELADYELALAFVDRDRLDEALPLLKKALQIGPHNVEARYCLGTIYLKQEHLEQAVVEYREALRYGEKKEARSNLGATLYRLGRFREAAEEFREILRRFPKDAVACNNLGVALFDMGDTPGAIAMYKEAVRLDPSYRQARANLDKTLKKQSQPSR